MLNLLFTTFYAIGNFNARNELNHIGKEKKANLSITCEGTFFGRKNSALHIHCITKLQLQMKDLMPQWCEEMKKGLEKAAD